MPKTLPTLPDVPSGQQMFQKAPRRLGELRERAGAASVPFHAQLYVEHRCNLACEHCFESEETHPAGSELTLEEIDRVLASLARLGTLQLTITGGEIFLRRDILDIVRLAKRHRFQITLFTSGYHIDERKADELAAIGVGQVDISLYSDRAEDHDAFTRIPGSWARSTRALRLLQERGVKASMKCVLTTFNVDRIDGIVALAEEIGCAWQLDPNVRPRMNNDTSTLRYALSPEELKRKVYGRRDLFPIFENVTPDSYCSGHEEPLPWGDQAMCGAARSTLAVMANGEVQPCGFFPTSVGNIRERGLEDIWTRSSLLEELRGATHNTMHSCPSCEVKASCRPCMAYSMVEHGDPWQCNTASRTSADALDALARSAVRATEKAERGRPLTIVGDVSLPSAGPSRLLFE